MDTIRAREALAELRAAAPVLGAWESAVRAQAILDRADLGMVDLTDYLESRGFEGSRLAHARGPFGKAVKARYIERYGVAPLKRLALINGEQRRVEAYIEDDIDLVEEVFDDLFAVVLGAL